MFFLEKHIVIISIKYFKNTIMDKYPLMDLVLTLYDPHFQCEADRLLVILHFLLIQNGFRVVDDVRQVCSFIFKERY